MGSLSAAAWVKYRKPTPWTIPDTKYRLAILASLTNRQNCSREPRFLPRLSRWVRFARGACWECAKLLFRKVASGCPKTNCAHPIHYETGWPFAAVRTHLTRFAELCFSPACCDL